ncbi:hypothetical protein JCM12141A_31530 [Mycolicibacterium hodleri]
MTETPAQKPFPSSESHADGLSTTPLGDGTGEPQKGNREARYRTERNAAREELAAANARLERMQRSEVERLASEHLFDGERSVQPERQ